VGEPRRAPPRPDELTISVNVSAFQLMSPDFTSTVEDVLKSTSTRPDLLTLEVTEGVFLQDSQRALVVLNDLKVLGVTLALDDFGTGYSSLNYLRQFPVDVVKIDQAFVADLGLDDASRAIVSAIVELSHALRIKVVAEGVETDRQRTEVIDLGCDGSQGFFFSRPLPAGRLDDLMRYDAAGEAPRLPLGAAVR